MSYKAHSINEGIPYFPHLTGMHSSTAIRRLIARHGIAGYGVWTYLLEKIYSKGYYLAWSPEEDAEVYAHEFKITTEELLEIIAHLTRPKFGLFSNALFTISHIFTSADIQSVFLHASGRRKRVYINAEHLLLDQSILDTFGTKVSILTDGAETATEKVDTTLDGEELTFFDRGEERRVKENIGASPAPAQRVLKGRPESYQVVLEYFIAKGYQDQYHESQKFYAYWESVGWIRGGRPMKSWKAAATQWALNAKSRGYTPRGAGQPQPVNQRPATPTRSPLSGTQRVDMSAFVTKLSDSDGVAK